VLDTKREHKKFGKKVRCLAPRIMEVHVAARVFGVGPVFSLGKVCFSFGPLYVSDGSALN